MFHDIRVIFGLMAFLFSAGGLYGGFLILKSLVFYLGIGVYNWRLYLKAALISTIISVIILILYQFTDSGIAFRYIVLFICLDFIIKVYYIYSDLSLFDASCLSVISLIIISITSIALHMPLTA